MLYICCESYIWIATLRTIRHTTLTCVIHLSGVHGEILHSSCTSSITTAATSQHRSSPQQNAVASRSLVGRSLQWGVRCLVK
jgi:hypothetical protein